MREISRFHVIAFPTLWALASAQIPRTKKLNMHNLRQFICGSLYKDPMRTLTFLTILLCVSVLWAQVQPPGPDPSKDPVYICPMDKDIRSNTPGNCSRCGMKLVAGVPDPVEFHLDLSVTPRVPRPGEKVQLQFDVHDPWKNNPVKKFNVVHEKLFHAFIVSEDLQVFVHDHPVWMNKEA
jgi:hypothetical protein